MSEFKRPLTSTRAKLVAAAAAACVAAGFVGVAQASPYASNVQISGGTTVNFTLNENADSLTYSINGGAPQAMPTGIAKGAHSFTLGSATDTFTINATKVDTTGYNTPTGDVLGNVATGLSKPTNKVGLSQSSDDNNLLNKFNSPRGVSVSLNPNASNFGSAYISNSAAGAVGGRTLTGDGVYALRADQTDAFGQGDAALLNDVFGAAATANSPYRTFVAANGEVYVAGFGDAISGVWRAPANLSSTTQLLTGSTGPAAVPGGQFHGSVTSSFVTGSSATGDLTLYTLDEDLSSLEAFGAGAGNDTNALWRYDIGAHDYGSGPYAGAPAARISGALIGENFSIVNDMERGADGKFYLSQNRAQPANTPGILVTDASGTTIFNSLQATRALLGDPAATDCFSNVFAIAVSPDQKWLAAMINIGDVALMPLIDGIPDIANRVVMDTLPNTISGRDIAFDAANNIHYVSSGQGLYRVLSPGGTQSSVLTWNGTAYSFASSEGELYWDRNGATAGAGGATLTGNWNGDANFNTDSTGGGAGLITGTAQSGDTVIFAAGSDGTGTYTVNVSGLRIAKGVSFARGNVTLSGGTLSVGVVDAAAGVTGTINSSVVGQVNNTSLVKTGAGTVVINSDPAWLGSTTVTAGTLAIKRMVTAADVAITGGTLQIIHSDPTGSNPESGDNAFVSRPNLFTISHNGAALGARVYAGKLDLTNNDLIIDYTGESPRAAFEDMVRAGYNVTGDWQGNGIVSSIAANDGNFVIAIADNAALAAPFGSAAGGPLFAGVDVDLDTILIKFTHRADINLDGLVTPDDSAIFGGAYDESITTGHTWAAGDMNYDGVCTPDDAAIFGGAYDESLESVPEPASLGLLALAGLGLARRRRNA